MGLPCVPEQRDARAPSSGPRGLLGRRGLPGSRASSGFVGAVATQPCSAPVRCRRRPGSPTSSAHRWPACSNASRPPSPPTRRPTGNGVPPWPDHGPRRRCWRGSRCSASALGALLGADPVADRPGRGPRHGVRGARRRPAAARPRVDGRAPGPRRTSRRRSRRGASRRRTAPGRRTARGGHRHRAVPVDRAGPPPRGRARACRRRTTVTPAVHGLLVALSVGAATSPWWWRRAPVAVRDHAPVDGRVLDPGPMDAVLLLDLLDVAIGTGCLAAARTVRGRHGRRRSAGRRPGAGRGRAAARRIVAVGVVGYGAGGRRRRARGQLDHRHGTRTGAARARRPAAPRPPHPCPHRCRGAGGAARPAARAVLPARVRPARPRADAAQPRGRPVRLTASAA